MSSDDPYTSSGDHDWPGALNRPADCSRPFQVEPSEPLAQGKTRQRSLSNSRILLPLLLASGLFWSVIWAYVDRPRLQASFGGVADTIPVRQSDFTDALVRSDRFRNDLGKRLTSAAFTAALDGKDVQQQGFFRKRQ